MEGWRMQGDGSRKLVCELGLGSGLAEGGDHTTLGPSGTVLSGRLLSAGLTAEHGWSQVTQRTAAFGPSLATGRLAREGGVGPR